MIEETGHVKKLPGTVEAAHWTGMYGFIGRLVNMMEQKRFGEVSKRAKLCCLRTISGVVIASVGIDLFVPRCSRSTARVSTL